MAIIRYIFNKLVSFIFCLVALILLQFLATYNELLDEGCQLSWLCYLYS
jgi:hypothetical protein